MQGEGYTEGACSLFELRRSAYAAYERDALVESWVPNVQDRPKKMLLEDGCVERRNRPRALRLCQELGRTGELPPASSAEQAENGWLLGFDGAVMLFDLKACCLHPLDELGWREPRAVGDYTVVGEDGELACGE